VLGQGYVGLSLATAAAAADFSVVGIDIDSDRVSMLARGELCVPGVREIDYQQGLSSGLLSFTTDTTVLNDSDVMFVCVPTPLRDHSPDLSLVERACTEVARHLSPGRLVILESTTYPGTTEQVVRPLLEMSGLSCTHDFLLAYSPERIDPGNQEFGFRDIPRVVGGATSEATGVSALFYQQLVDKVMVVSSCRAAELAKLLENTFRHVNVALVNEMAMLCNEINIDVWEVIDAAASKPFGFMPFYPGPGVGGHCIPLDPTYLAWQVRRDAGHQFRILEQGQDINAQMPAHVAARVGDALNDSERAVRGAKIFVLGVAYKPDVGDVRESPALKVMSVLRKRGAKVSWHDPHIDELSINGTIERRSELSQRTVSEADCVVLLTPHKSYDLDWIGCRARLIFDARNAYGQDRRTNVVRL
jgi:UDP-N-acetyl-D-glucosamine dehydrogenase